MAVRGTKIKTIMVGELLTITKIITIMMVGDRAIRFRARKVTGRILAIETKTMTDGNQAIQIRTMVVT